MKQRFLLLIAVVCLGCRHDGLHNGRVANLSPDLITDPRAENIKSRAAPGYERLYYEVEVAYPARPVIRAIAAQLASRGWQPTRNSWFNGDEASEYVRGWVQSTVVAKPGGKERFLARWKYRPAKRPVILLPVGTPPNVETATDNSPNPHVFQIRPDGG